MNIGLFGGSFNPPHIGHRIFAGVFKEKGNLDQVWVMVNPEPPHKSDIHLIDYHYRLEMSKMNFNSMDGVIINEIETSLPSPHYTIDSLKHIISLYPDCTFYLCIGEDSLRTFDSWKSPNEIFSLVDLFVVKRDNATDKLPNIVLQNSDKIHWLEADTIPISSNMIRSKLKRGEDISEYLLPEVHDYIKKHKLYIV